jgi:hypothetical protein
MFILSILHEALLSAVAFQTLCVTNRNQIGNLWNRHLTLTLLCQFQSDVPQFLRSGDTESKPSEEIPSQKFLICWLRDN